MKKTIISVISLISLLFVPALLRGCFVGEWIDPDRGDYIAAFELYENGKYKEAAQMFEKLGEYKESGELKNRSLYIWAGECFESGDFEEAANAYGSVAGYLNSSELKTRAENEKNYAAAAEMFENGEYDKAKEIFGALGDYRDSEDYIVWTSYLQANGLMASDPDGAVEELFSLTGYNGELTELINDILYNKALLYMQEENYEKALPVFERMQFKESAGLAALCGKHIKYKNAAAMFERGETDGAYLQFSELGDFIDSAAYILYIEAGRAADGNNFGEAADKYKKVSDRFDCRDLYEKYIYLYYDTQFQQGNRDLSKLPLLPLTDPGEAALWRAKRLKDINEAIDGAGTSAAEVTGLGIYINDRLNLYYVKDLIAKITEDLPVFFLADCLEKVRYTLDFPGSAKYFGTYDDGTLGYETTISVALRDAVSGEVIFSESYTAYPDAEVYFPESQKKDVYAVYDFFASGEGGLSAYDRDILPVLRALWQ